MGCATESHISVAHLPGHAPQKCKILWRTPPAVRHRNLEPPLTCGPAPRCALSPQISNSRATEQGARSGQPDDVHAPLAAGSPTPPPPPEETPLAAGSPTPPPRRRPRCRPLRHHLDTGSPTPPPRRRHPGAIFLPPPSSLLSLPPPSSLLPPLSPCHLPPPPSPLHRTMHTRCLWKCLFKFLNTTRHPNDV